MSEYCLDGLVSLHAKSTMVEVLGGQIDYYYYYYLILVAPSGAYGNRKTPFHFSILKSYGQSVGLLGQGISPSQGRYLHRNTQTQNKCTQTSMP
jgi:hypothetical protein